MKVMRNLISRLAGVREQNGATSLGRRRLLGLLAATPIAAPAIVKAAPVVTSDARLMAPLTTIGECGPELFLPCTTTLQQARRLREIQFQRFVETLKDFPDYVWLDDESDPIEWRRSSPLIYPGVK